MACLAKGEEKVGGEKHACGEEQRDGHPASEAPTTENNAQGCCQQNSNQTNCGLGNAVVPLGDVGEVVGPLDSTVCLEPAVEFRDAEVALVEAGFDPAEVMAKASDPAVKEQLKRATEEAIGRGVFGAPTCFVDGEMFFGQDRLDWIEAAARS